MKTILVDAINCFILEDTTILKEMHDILEKYPNRKIILTGADDKVFKEFKLDQAPYEVFTLKHNPEKSDPEYFKIFLKQFELKPEKVVYFEHNQKAVESARSVGITSYYYNEKEQDLVALKNFLDENLS